MKRTATTCLVLAGFLAATSAWALNIPTPQATQPHGARQPLPLNANAVLGCDDGVTWSGWYQNADDRLGNVFNFGAGAVLSTVSFVHYDYGNAGPYSYSLDVWDPASCTFVATKSGLVASDVKYTNVTESVDMCGLGLRLTGSMFVGIHPQTCLSPTNCYPDLVWDNQLGVVCPVIINNASTAPVCNDISGYGGPFLLRVATDGCATPARRDTWGQLKTIYR